MTPVERVPLTCQVTLSPAGEPACLALALGQKTQEHIGERGIICRAAQ